MSNQPAVVGPDGVARPYIGGQALIEGVMMRSPHAFSAVVRRRDGSLTVHEEPMQDMRRGKAAWPLVRGVVALVEALKLGSRALRFSVDLYEKDLEEEERQQKEKEAQQAGASPSGAQQAGAHPKPAPPSTLSLLSLPIIALVTNEPELPPQTAVGPAAKPGKGQPGKDEDEGKRKLLTFFSILFALTLFVALPQLFAQGTSSLFGLGLDVRAVGFQLLTGAAKMTIVVGYMLVIRRMPEIYRVFQYHGAEHKSIYAYEAGEALSVENARKKTTLHPRCGTTFIVMVALVSIVVFSGLGPFLPDLGLGKLADNVLFFLLKLPFLPFIAAITFELQRFLARYATRGPLRALLWPGFLVQKITTIEPDDRQLEVALSALSVTVARERKPAQEFSGERSFSDFSTLTAGGVAEA